MTTASASSLLRTTVAQPPPFITMSLMVSSWISEGLDDFFGSLTSRAKNMPSTQPIRSGIPAGVKGPPQTLNHQPPTVLRRWSWMDFWRRDSGCLDMTIPVDKKRADPKARPSWGGSISPRRGCRPPRPRRPPRYASCAASCSRPGQRRVHVPRPAPRARPGSCR